MLRIYAINPDGTISVPSEPVTMIQGQLNRVTDTGSVVKCSKAKLATLFNHD